jgi:hypothetical protein
VRYSALAVGSGSIPHRHSVNQRLTGACNRSPGSKLLSITMQLHCGGHLGGRAQLPDTILEEDHPMTIPSLKQQSAGRHVAPLGYIILITNQPGLEYTIYRTRGEHANHYATNAIKCLLKYNRISRNRTHITWH